MTLFIPRTSLITHLKHHYSLFFIYHYHNLPSNQPQQQQQQQNSLASLIKSCSTKTRLLQIHAQLLRTSQIQNPIILDTFLTTIQDLNYSRLFFTQIPSPTLFHYNTIIKAYSQSNSPIEGFKFYNQMRRRGTRPNPLSSSFVLKLCTRISSLICGRQIHTRVLVDGQQSDCQLLTILMNFYAHCGGGIEARKVFDEMSHRDTVAWNVLISCYTRNGRTRDALGLFDVMQTPEYGSNKPDDVTCLLVIQACANLGALEFGGRIHCYVDECGYGEKINIRNSLISMYSRCGCVDKAFGVFRRMSERNVVTWSAMISGLAMNGFGREAVNAFREMQKVGVSPDDQTFTGVLSACSHSGLVDEGLMFFDCMKAEFGIKPGVHHYGCVVDLLGRAGLLDQAYQLIVSMQVKPDSTIWRTLLGACRIHRHVSLGERVIGHLIELKAQEAGDFVLLLNIYASVGAWDKVADVRRLMKEKGIQTSPGCSTIEVHGTVHEFGVDDNRHSRIKEVYATLDEIERQLKIVGYVAETSAELHNLAPEEKGNVISYHSEKLAIAFGILATPPGTTVRVAKNLRFCVDCHNFAKVVSSVYNREIIIRDRSRFHHFREGNCSCNDYW